MALMDLIRHRLRMIWLGLTLKPIAGADDGVATDAEAQADGETDESAEGEDQDAESGQDKVDHSDRPNWESESRKHERAAKRERKAREAAERKLREMADADKSEQEKAIEKAREEARTAALAEADSERRSDRLEVAVTRLAAKGVEVGEEDAKSVRFADAEDALVNVERLLATGDVDSEDIFDGEGKVQTEALGQALAGILQRKPHLAAGEGEKPKPKGDADAGKGSSGGKSIDDLTAEEHFQRIRRHKG